MHKLGVAILVAIMTAAVALPAARSQAGSMPASPSTCELSFKLADLNNDGVLTMNELGNEPFLLPASLPGDHPITIAEFVAACMTNAPRSGM